MGQNRQRKTKTPDGMERPRLELLAPAGTPEACRAAIHAGADAVYLSGNRFGARAYADNFSQDELFVALDYAHLHEKKIFLTVNTLLKQREIADELYPFLKPLYERGLDAVIVQDFGVMHLIHTQFPQLPIHISTQMSVADAHGAAFLKEQGATRVVTARELSLAEIRAIHDDVEIELECFIHGALCYCYSGQCLLSSMIGGRSGNRGRCAQPCRLPYAVLDEGRHMVSDAKEEAYPLSPKDLCAVALIPELAQAGVYSFKIEGRMKSAAYAAGVTSVYRKYIDLYLNGTDGKVLAKDRERLLETGSRSGFTEGYYNQRNGKNMMAMRHSGHRKDGVSSERAAAEYLKADKKIPVQAELFLAAGEPAMLTMREPQRGIQGFAQIGAVEPAKKQPLSEADAKAQISKTGNTPFYVETASVTIQDAVFLPKQALNQLRRDALENLTELCLAPYRRAAAPGQMPDPISEDTVRSGNAPLFTASIERAEQLAPVVSAAFVSRVYLDGMLYGRESFFAQLAEHAARLHAAGKEAYFALPAVFRRHTAAFYEANFQKLLDTGVDGFLVRTMDELGFLKEKGVAGARCVLDASLYTYSDHARAAYAAAGFSHDTVPFELNKKELRARHNAQSELVVYGRTPLMVSAQCIQKNLRACGHKSGLLFLKDRYKNEFPVKNHCTDCYNVIYNSLPLSLIQLADELEALQAEAYRMQFTVEDAARVQKITDSCRQAFLDRRIPDMAEITGGYTNGHYKRGIE